MGQLIRVSGDDLVAIKILTSVGCIGNRFVGRLGLCL
jgi:hypothetical protein